MRLRTIALLAIGASILALSTAVGALVQEPTVSCPPANHNILIICDLEGCNGTHEVEEQDGGVVKEKGTEVQL